MTRAGSVLTQEIPVVAASSGPVRPWSVMHATDDVRQVLELAEAQRGLGMRPVLVTPAGYGSIELYLRERDEEERSVSLLGTWQEVRQWRKSLGDCGAAAAMEIVHAHCFAAGMSGVRNWPVVVYDLSDFVEQDAEADQQWLARSLRVAEQFVLARAEAVVVHRTSQRAKALERGAPAEHLFVVPEALPREDAPTTGGRDRLGPASDPVELYAAEVMPEELDALLSALVQIVAEVPETKVLLPESGEAAASLREKLAAAGVSARAVPGAQHHAVLRSADVVLCAAASGDEPNDAMLLAMRQGRAVLAADGAANRDISPDGRGCLWYKPGNARDLANRGAFLARNADFRRSLGDAARAFLEETRSPEAVARRYDAVYRHAFARRGDDPREWKGRFEPLTAML
ncbi:MAG TPA: glycosyltransferase family 4 protein [Terriglobales bacterium]|nr:glycosyltransferase family 4 protein [Terriglobales bacterium]